MNTNEPSKPELEAPYPALLHREPDALHPFFCPIFFVQIPRPMDHSPPFIVMDARAQSREVGGQISFLRQVGHPFSPRNTGEVVSSSPSEAQAEAHSSRSTAYAPAATVQAKPPEADGDCMSAPVALKPSDWSTYGQAWKKGSRA